MSTATETSKTREQITAEFAAAFKGVKPVRPIRPSTLEHRLRPYRTEIMKLRRRGLAWAQIAAGMAGPVINVKVSTATLKRCFGAKRKTRPAAQTGPVPSPLVVDPATDQRTTPPPSAR